MIDVIEKNKLDVKTLIGVARLTYNQLIQYFNHYNYNLKGATVEVKSNDLNNQKVIHSGIIENVNEKYIYIKNEHADVQPVALGPEKILIIYKIGKPAYAVYND
ncbi:MAG: hypothetical protein WCL02_00995 [bacterium]